MLFQYHGGSSIYVSIIAYHEWFINNGFDMASKNLNHDIIFLRAAGHGIGL